MPHTQFTVNSADVDTSQFTLNKYRINLPNTYFRVSAIELVSCELPRTHYTVNSTNNMLDFKEGTTTYSATLTQGSYDKTSFCSMVGTVMTSAGGQTYTCAVTNDAVNKVTISAAGAFSLLFGSGSHVKTSAGSILGYTASDLTGSNTYTATNISDIGGNRFLYLRVNNVPHAFLSSSGLAYFAKVPLNCDVFGVSFWTKDTYSQKHELFDRINLDSLDIEWVGADGKAVDFNGVHHSYTLSVHYE